MAESPFSQRWPDRVYRRAAQSVVEYLLMENERLRLNPGRPPSRLAQAIAWGVERGMRHGRLPRS